MSRVVRKLAFCTCGFLHMRLFAYAKTMTQISFAITAKLISAFFRYTDTIIPLLPKSEHSRLYPSSVTVQPGLCRTWSETPKTGFLTTILPCHVPASTVPCELKFKFLHLNEPRHEKTCILYMRKPRRRQAAQSVPLFSLHRYYNCSIS